MRQLKATILAASLLSATNVTAMPAETATEYYSSWVAAKFDNIDEFWAYTELDDGMLLAFAASRDVVGPGCYFTKLVVMSDTQSIAGDDWTVTLNLGADELVKGAFIQTSREWAAMYGLVNIDASHFDNLIHAAYRTDQKLISMQLQQDGKVKHYDVGRLAGMRNASKRAIDMCREDVTHDEWLPYFNRTTK